jgi:uncharacterized coiled-coil protein SlyX
VNPILESIGMAAVRIIRLEEELVTLKEQQAEHAQTIASLWKTINAQTAEIERLRTVLSGESYRGVVG